MEYEVLGLQEAATTRLAELQRHREEGTWCPLDFNRQLGNRAEQFVMARACAANGMDDLAYGLYTFTVHQPTGGRPLREIVSR